MSLLKVKGLTPSFRCWDAPGVALELKLWPGRDLQPRNPHPASLSMVCKWECAHSCTTGRRPAGTPNCSPGSGLMANASLCRFSSFTWETQSCLSTKGEPSHTPVEWPPYCTPVFPIPKPLGAGVYCLPQPPSFTLLPCRPPWRPHFL